MPALGWRKTYPDSVRVATGCLLWQGPTSSEGYALRGGKEYEHIRVYVAAGGEIPPGWQVDHVYARGCRYRHCIEVTHLEAVPPGENVRRQPRLVKQTHCVNGHERTPENLRVRVRGTKIKRECRVCHNERQVAYGRERRNKGW